MMIYRLDAALSALGFLICIPQYSKATERCTLPLAILCSPHLHRHCDDTAVLTLLVLDPLEPQLSPMHRRELKV